MQLARNYDTLLKGPMLFGCLFLLMGCSADPGEEPQPAQLIKVTSYNHFHDITYQHLPKGDADGILAVQDLIELVFDKAVLEAIIEIDNVLGNAKPNGVPPTTIWMLESRQLDVWSPGFTPERNVPFTVIYEDKTGLYKETLEVTLGSYHISSYPPAIESSNIWVGQVDADANALNREGIKISFDKAIDVLRSQIEVYRGQRKLNWKLYWTDKNETAILLPESEDDWLLPGHEYEVHLIDFYDIVGRRGEGLEDGPLVIRFQTAG